MAYFIFPAPPDEKTERIIFCYYTIPIKRNLFLYTYDPIYIIIELKIFEGKKKGGSIL